jgi:hypothetical protein
VLATAGQSAVLDALANRCFIVHVMNTIKWTQSGDESEGKTMALVEMECPGGVEAMSMSVSCCRYLRLVSQKSRSQISL